MELLVAIIDEEHLDEVLEAFIELGIMGATVINTEGMGRILVRDVPIFAGLRSLLEGKRPANKTIFAVVKEEKVRKAMEVVEEICGPLDGSGRGILFTIPVNMVKGLRKE